MAFTPSDFKVFKPRFPNRKWHRRAERAAVGVQADALELEIFSVQPEAGVGLEMGVADAEGSCLRIQNFFAVAHFG